jgi:heme oxygenase
MNSTQLAQILKTETRPFHDSAEGSEFQNHLTSGEVSLAQYVAYLSQLFLIHSLLEREIIDASDREPRLKQVVGEEQLQENYLRADLVHFAVSFESIRPLKATEQFSNQMLTTARQTPVALLGYHYVLFGSKHGGKFIAKNLSHVHKLNGAGTKYFDPYGDDFMPYWRAFVEHLNKLDLSPAEIEATVAAAKETFIAVGQIGAELSERSTLLHS